MQRIAWQCNVHIARGEGASLSLCYNFDTADTFIFYSQHDQTDASIRIAFGRTARDGARCELLARLHAVRAKQDPLLHPRVIY